MVNRKKNNFSLGFKKVLLGVDVVWILTYCFMRPSAYTASCNLYNGRGGHLGLAL